MSFVEECGVPRRTVFRANSMFAQYRAVAAGAGVAILPDFLASFDMALAPVLSSEIRLRRTFWMVCGEEVRHLSRIQAAIKQLKAVVEEGRRELLPDGESAVVMTKRAEARGGQAVGVPSSRSVVVEPRSREQARPSADCMANNTRHRAKGGRRVRSAPESSGWPCSGRCSVTVRSSATARCSTRVEQTRQRHRDYA